MVKSLQEALTQAGFRGYHFRACCFASASIWFVASYSPYYNQIKDAIKAELDADYLLIENDACVALWGAFSGMPGMVCIAGTGAVVLARTQNGEIIRAGGWGHMLGDEGSAYRIGLDAIQAALRAYDGVGDKTSLLDCVRRFFQWQDLQEAINFFYGQPFFRKHDVAKLAPAVIAEAKRGDRKAMEIVNKNVSFLARCVRLLSQKAHVYKVAPIGGLFQNEFFRELFTKKLMGTGISCVAADLPPVLGAVALAMQVTGVLTQEVVAQLKQSAATLKWNTG